MGESLELKSPCASPRNLTFEFRVIVDLYWGYIGGYIGIMENGNYYLGFRVQSCWHSTSTLHVTMSVGSYKIIYKESPKR